VVKGLLVKHLQGLLFEVMVSGTIFIEDFRGIS